MEDKLQKNAQLNPVSVLVIPGKILTALFSFKTQVWSWVDVLRSSAVVLETDFDRPALGAGRKGACSVSSPGGYRTLSERHCGRTAAQPGLPPPQEYFLTEKEVKHKYLKTSYLSWLTIVLKKQVKLRFYKRLPLQK